MTRAAHARINLAALQHNLQTARNSAPNSKILAVIKANAYGHGMLEVAKTLEQADAFAVACVAEAIKLREAGNNKPIVLLEGFNTADDLILLQHYSLIPVIHHEHQVQQLEVTTNVKNLQVWLKIDTGMHRLGIAPARAYDVFNRLQAAPSVSLIPVVMTHLACADARNNPYTQKQIELFNTTIKTMHIDAEVAYSVCNSGGLLGWIDAQADWVRPGIMLYGMSPFEGEIGKDHGLIPVMRLHSEVIAVNQFQRGDTIGYGCSYTCPEDMLVGVIAIGYGDGYPRHAKPGTPVLLNGQRVPLVGRVSMDMITVDLRNQENTKIGDPVELWGENLPAEEIAAFADTISYELLCGVTQRVEFEYVAS